ncbi:MAG: hypothetical protein ACODAE_04370, partial [Gemmatimonadota bacterium]
NLSLAHERLYGSLGVALEVRTIGGDEPANRALAEASAPAWAEAGEPIDVDVGVVARGELGDSIDVAIEHDGRPLARTRIGVPERGRVGTATLRITPEAPGEEGGLVRYDAVIGGTDAVADDDRRSVYVHVSDRPSGVVLLSFAPDWEPRFLQPTLEQSLGMPVQGYLHVAPERYLTTGVGDDAARPAQAEEVRRAAAEAELVVLHGLDGGAPAWARELAVSAPRVLVLPGREAQELELPIPLPERGGGEWYAVDEVPSSPVASLMASLDVADLPPLTGVRPASPAGRQWTPIDLRRGRNGPRAPLMLAGEDGARRWAVALAEGYWRWAFRGGDASRVYRRIWSAVGGWLVEDRRDATLAAVRPASRVVPRGAQVQWAMPGLNADSVALEVGAEGPGTDAARSEAAADDAASARGPDSGVAGDGPESASSASSSSSSGERRVVRVRGDTAVTPALPPGHYRYRATAYADGEAVAEGGGPFTVASYTGEFTRSRVALDDVTPSTARAEPDVAGAGGRPLHTTPWPYVALLAILCTEWVLRRRWGLR